MKKRLLISFSGGRTSAYMTWWLLNKWERRHEYEIIIVFSNTGKEKEETLVFVERCAQMFGHNIVWLECVSNPTRGIGPSAKIVSFETANRTGEPFEGMIKKHGIPNQTQPQCSREMKGYTIRAYARSIGWKKYETAIGIRYDEKSRVDWVKAKKERLVYPLVTMIKTTKSDVNLFWSKQEFDLELKSYEGNCDLCWKKSMRKLMTIAKENPTLTEWWREMEEKYENYTPESRQHNKKIKPPHRFFRGNMTVDDILEESKFPFVEAKDESKDIDMWKQSAMWNEELDSNAGCVESCEAF